MYILVINSGSSSIKFSGFDVASQEDTQDPQLFFDGELSAIGEVGATLEIQDANGKRITASESDVEAQTPGDAIRLIFKAIGQLPTALPDAVGYRVVHPGAKLDKHQLITDEVLHDLEEAASFAPLHDPSVVGVIRQGMAQFPAAVHYACFDTVFHQSMPAEATTYPIPIAFRKQGVRRYGFHGLSCESIVRQMRADGAKLPKRMVIAHLGSGCSVTALLDGCSIDTTMGLTPTGGVVMGTRTGDLDPGLVLYLLRQQNGNLRTAISTIEKMLSQQSGIVALAGLPNDIKAVRQSAVNGDEHARLALKVFTRSITKAIGGFCWLLGGLDAVVFAGGIGEHDPYTRDEILCGLEHIGVCIDPALNQARGNQIRRINSPESKLAVFVVPAQEALIIAIYVEQMNRSGHKRHETRLTTR